MLTRKLSRPAVAVLSLLTLAVAAGALWLGFGAQRVNRPQFVDQHRGLSESDFEQRVRAYLLKHPEVIAEALQLYESQQQAAAEREAKLALRTKHDELVRDPDSPVFGNPKGDVTLVQFFDYNCRFCRQAAPHITAAIAADSGLRVVYKEFPILGPASMIAARAALAAGRQGKYLPLHEALMHAKEPHSETTILDLAGRLGIDVDRLKREMSDPALQTALARNLNLGQVLRINGTPAFVIGDHIEQGAIELQALQRLIAAARQKK